MNKELQFIKDPKEDLVIASFPKSLFFWESAFKNRANGIGLWTDLLAATIESRVVGMLAWSLSSYERVCTLKIDAIEIIPDYRWQYIWPRLLYEAENMNTWKFDTVQWFLNNPFNVSSARMFLKSWFLRNGPYFFIKEVPNS